MAIWIEPPMTVPNIIPQVIANLLQNGQYTFRLLRAAETLFNAANTGELKILKASFDDDRREIFSFVLKGLLKYSF